MLQTHIYNHIYIFIHIYIYLMFPIPPKECWSFFLNNCLWAGWLAPCSRSPRQVCLMRWSARSSSWMWFALEMPWLRVPSFVNGKPPWPYWKLGPWGFSKHFLVRFSVKNHGKAFVLKSSHAFNNKGSEVSFCDIAGGLRNVFFLGPTQSLTFFLGFLGWFCGH